MLRRPAVHIGDLAGLNGDIAFISKDAAEQAEIAVKYEGYLERQRQQIAHFEKAEGQLLPEDADYLSMSALRIEARQKLHAQRPRSLGQAARIPGVSPGDMAVLMVWLERERAAQKRRTGDGE